MSGYDPGSGTIYLDRDTSRWFERMERTNFYSLHGGLNIARVYEHEYCYLNKQTGEWVADNSLFGPITGHDGSADCHEISFTEAEQWVRDNLPGIEVSWV